MLINPNFNYLFKSDDFLQVCWWSAPDERAHIRFRNGNVYEGNISMKCMHGEGRYQWSDGTVYLVSDFRINYHNFYFISYLIIEFRYFN